VQCSQITVFTKVLGSIQYCIGVSNTFADLEDLEDLEDLDAEVAISSVWEYIRKNVEISAQENIGCNELKNKPWFKYLGTTVTNKYLIQKKIKRRLNSGNASYHSVQILLSSCLLYTDLIILIIIYKNIILPVFLYGCENLFLILKREHKQRVLENSVLRRYLDRRGMK
jgi:uncharacterized protein YlaI